MWSMHMLDMRSDVHAHIVYICACMTMAMDMCMDMSCYMPDVSLSLVCPLRSFGATAVVCGAGVLLGATK